MEFIVRLFLLAAALLLAAPSVAQDGAAASLAPVDDGNAAVAGEPAESDQQPPTAELSDSADPDLHNDGESDDTEIVPAVAPKDVAREPVEQGRPPADEVPGVAEPVADVGGGEPAAAGNRGPAVEDSKDDGPSTARRRLLRVAVVDPKRAGVNARTSGIVMRSLVAELRKLERVSVVGMDEVRAMLDFEADRQLLGCDEEACLTEIGDALGVDELLVASLVVSNGVSSFSVRRINQTEARVEGAVEERLSPADGEEFLAAIGPAVAELYPEKRLRKGQERGVPEEVARLINPPPLPTWSFYAALGVTGVTLMGSAVAAGATLLFNQRVAAALARSQTQTVSGAGVMNDHRAATVAAWTANGLLVVAGGFAVATGVMAFFVDWRGAAGRAE